MTALPAHDASFDFSSDVHSYSVLRSRQRCLARLLLLDLRFVQVDPHCALYRVATSSCRGHIDELATEPSLLLQREHGTDCRRR